VAVLPSDCSINYLDRRGLGFHSPCTLLMGCRAGGGPWMRARRVGSHRGFRRGGARPSRPAWEGDQSAGDRSACGARRAKVLW